MKAQTPTATASPETIAFRAALDVVGAALPEVADSIRQELADQRSHLKLIASENFASPAVLLAMGNWLSDKYAEGSPGHRFYAGCDNVDAIESRAVELAKSLFGAQHAYVQPHSGIDANLVAFWAVLTHRVEAPELERLNAKDVRDLSAEDWEGLRRKLGSQKMMGITVEPQTNLIDYDEVRKRAREERPLLLIAGYSSYPRRINFRTFREIADEVGATFMVDMAHFAGLVAGKVYTGDFEPVRHAHIVTTTTHKTLRGPRGGMVLCDAELAGTVDRGCPLVLGGPLPHIIAAKAVALHEASQPEFATYARRIVDNAAALAEALQSNGVTVVTGGSENHIVLVDVRPFGLTGRQGEAALRSAGVTLNRNVIPYDTNGSWYTSGLRLGTPAVTTLGMAAAEMQEIAAIIAGVLRATAPTKTTSGKPSLANYTLDEPARSQAEGRARDLLGRFPLYPEIEL
ncbi:MAG: serine hydroxymethyltransferase [Chloroflexi bacterium]|nr:MAG: serine hydroxymethyltransferase [Chloroflexota bacterium]